MATLEGQAGQTKSLFLLRAYSCVRVFVCVFEREKTQGPDSFLNKAEHLTFLFVPDYCTWPGKKSDPWIHKRSVMPVIISVFC